MAYRNLLLAGLGIGSTMALLLSCDFGAGLRDVGGALASPDSALLDTPGRKLAAGKFERLVVDGSLREGGKVIALQDAQDGRQVSVIPYPEGEPCSISPAVGFDRLSSRIDVELPGLFAVQRDDTGNGRGEVQLINFDCEQQYSSIENARLPRTTFPSDSPEGMLTIDGDGELSFIVPGQEQLQRIADDVTIARTSQDYIFAQRNGGLVVFDKKLKEIDSFGKKVVDFSPHQGREISLAYVTQEQASDPMADEAASSEEGKTSLFLWNEKGGSEKISDDACEPSFWGSDVLAYLEPCAERRLVLRAPRTSLGQLQEGVVKLIGPRNITSLERRIVQLPASKSTLRIALLIGEAGARAGRLHYSYFPDDFAADDDSEQVELVSQKIGAKDSTIIGSEILVDFDGSVGTLVDVQYDDDNRPVELQPLAEGVLKFFGSSASSPRGFLANYDGLVGDLTLLEQEGEGWKTKQLLAGVPNQDFINESETGRLALIADSEDGRTGTLYLSDRSATKYEPIVEDAIAGASGFVEQPRGLSYLIDVPGERVARLEVYLIDPALSLRIHSQVSEYRILPWPSPGILYAVAEGKDQGLWYAKAR